MTTAGLFLAVLLGSVGAGYCLYGAKQRRGAAFASGAALIVLPFFISNTYILVAAGLACAVLPFVVKARA